MGIARTALTTAELREYLQRRLPEYMVPSVFVALEELPLTPNGKVNRKALPAPDGGKGRAEGESYQSPSTPVRPRDFIELQLTHIWEELLNYRLIGLTDSFFELGGHSLLAVSLMTRIEKAFGVKLPLHVLFQNDTIEHLAAELRCQREYINHSALMPIQPRGTKRPLFCAPPAGGGVDCYYNLAHFLGMEQPFYAFRAYGS